MYTFRLIFESSSVIEIKLTMYLKFRVKAKKYISKNVAHFGYKAKWLKRY